MLWFFEAHCALITYNKMQVFSKDLIVNDFLFYHNGQVMSDTNIFYIKMTMRQWMTARYR